MKSSSSFVLGARRVFEDLFVFLQRRFIDGMTAGAVKS
jgi:ABC-type maltose transport system permease subunit